jgi:ribA/ribD-fused uncharacterized protein
METHPPTLGVDFGRVIQGGDVPDGNDDTQFLGSSYDTAMQSPATVGMFDALPRLVERFDGRVWIISKCGPRIRHLMLSWLEFHDFYDRTGVPRDNVRYCAKRAEKAGHCIELGVTHMIDDRLDVHSHLRGVVENLYLFGTQRTAVAPPWVTSVRTWTETEAAIAAEFAGRAVPVFRIESFSGPYRTLSNFAPYPTTFDGIEYPTAEHAYVAAKTIDRVIRDRVRSLPGPGGAKHFGRSIELRSDWLDVREAVMLDILRSKFGANPEAAQFLLSTGSVELVEGNRWHDNYWGRCDCKPCRRQGIGGLNTLGRLLMQVRRELVDGTDS